MKKLLAKFKVGSVVDFGNNNKQANLSPVVRDTEENKTFSLYTPSGSIQLHITNPEALDFFEAGEEYYITFEKSVKQIVTTCDLK